MPSSSLDRLLWFNWLNLPLKKITSNTWPPQSKAVHNVGITSLLHHPRWHHNESIHNEISKALVQKTHGLFVPAFHGRVDRPPSILVTQGFSTFRGLLFFGWNFLRLYKFYEKPKRQNNNWNAQIQTFQVKWAFTNWWWLSNSCSGVDSPIFIEMFPSNCCGVLSPTKPDQTLQFPKKTWVFHQMKWNWWFWCANFC